jgi:hypothetical protein
VQWVLRPLYSSGTILRHNFALTIPLHSARSVLATKLSQLQRLLLFRWSDLSILHVFVRISHVSLPVTRVDIEFTRYSTFASVIYSPSGSCYNALTVARFSRRRITLMGRYHKRGRERDWIWSPQ